MRYLRKILVIATLLLVLMAAFPASALAHHARPCCPPRPKVVVPRHPPRPYYVVPRYPPRPHYVVPHHPHYRVPVKHPPKYVSKVYVVKRSDTLSGIARRFGTSVRAILAANPHIKDPNVIRVGQRLVIPW